MVPLSPANAEPGASASPRASPQKEKALRSLGSLPPFSPILTRLMATLAGEDVSFSALGDLIEKDTVVAANLLHLVNSALYARRGQVSSVRHALSLLGITKLRNAVLGMSIARVWNRVNMPASWSMARFNMHSAAVAVLSDLLAQRLRVEYPEGAFVAGLLHDTGRLLIALSLPEEYERVLGLYNRGGQAFTCCEQEVLGCTHPELSAAALEFWKLPEQIQIAVRDHHTPSPKLALGSIIDAANQYVNSVGICILARTTDGCDAGVIESLGLAPEKLAELLAEFQSENDAMMSYFR